MPEVNGIPTAGEFKAQIGRTGLSRFTKKHDTQIDTLLAYVQNAGYWRNNMTQGPSLLCERFAKPASTG